MGHIMLIMHESVGGNTNLRSSGFGRVDHSGVKAIKCCEELWNVFLWEHIRIAFQISLQLIAGFLAVEEGCCCEYRVLDSAVEILEVGVDDMSVFYDIFDSGYDLGGLGCEREDGRK